MTGPNLEVDPDGLDHLARDLVAMSNSLTEEAVVHDSSPATSQPSGAAVSALIASADHVVGECAGQLMAFGNSVAAAADYYRASDAAGADAISATMPPK